MVSTSLANQLNMVHTYSYQQYVEGNDKKIYIATVASVPYSDRFVLRAV